jgi:hypothetical protein
MLTQFSPLEITEMKLGLILSLSILANVLGAGVCDSPGMIDFFPLNETTGFNGICHPTPIALVPVGGATQGQCGDCGMAARLPAPLGENVMNTSSLAIPPQLLASIVSGGPFTLQMDYSTHRWAVNGNFSNSGLLEIIGSTGIYFEIFYDSIGRINVHDDIRRTYFQVDEGITPDNCNRISFVCNGIDERVYFDGVLVGGPVLIGDIQSSGSVTGNFLPVLAGNDPTLVSYYSNILFSNAVVPSPQVALTGCVIATPTVTPTTQATETATPEGCFVSVRVGGDATFGATHTVIWTCTPVADPTATDTPGCSVSILLPPNGTVGPRTLIATCTAQVPNTMTQTFSMTHTPRLSQTFSSTPTPTRTPPTCGAVIPRIVTPYKQSGPTAIGWSGNQLDHSEDPKDHIGTRGCYVTCLAMLTGSDPGEVNTMLTNANPAAINSSGQVVEARAYGTLGYSGVQRISTQSDSDVGVQMNAGNDVIVEVEGPHFVVVTGYVFDPTTQRCRYSINDPRANNPKSYLDEYTFSTLRVYSK